MILLIHLNITIDNFNWVYYGIKETHKFQCKSYNIPGASTIVTHFLKKKKSYSNGPLHPMCLFKKAIWSWKINHEQ